MAGQSVGLVGAVAPNQIGEGVSFFVFVVLCGGANACIVMRFFGCKPGKRGMRAIAGLGLVIAIAPQVTAGDEEFVPYDDGPPVPADQLRIADRNGGPDRVTLANGRILMPKSREADLRKFLDRWQ